MQIDRLFSEHELSLVNVFETLTACNDVATGYGYVQGELEATSNTDASAVVGDAIRAALGEEGHITDSHVRRLDRGQTPPTITPQGREILP